jgi:hypothetical protein
MHEKNDRFDDKFGFTEKEVVLLLRLHRIEYELSDVRLWYNGYKIGKDSTLYNPWSIVSLCAQKGKLKNYWVETGNLDFPCFIPPDKKE